MTPLFSDQPFSRTRVSTRAIASRQNEAPTRGNTHGPEQHLEKVVKIESIIISYIIRVTRRPPGFICGDIVIAAA